MGQPVKKFMNGQMTPNEVHRKLAFGGRKCDVCGDASVVRVRTFADAKEAVSRSPEFMMQLAAKNDGKVPVVDFTYGKFVLVGEAFACSRCKSELMKQAAKAPDWCLVEIDEGPDPKEKVSIQSSGMPVEK